MLVLLLLITSSVKQHYGVKFNLIYNTYILAFGALDTH